MRVPGGDRKRCPSEKDNRPSPQRTAKLMEMLDDLGVGDL